MRVLRALALVCACLGCAPAPAPVVRPIAPVEPEPAAPLASAADAEVLEGPCAVALDPATPATLTNVFFEVNSARLKPESCCAVVALAKAIVAHPAWRLVAVEVHSDERGNDAYNLKLSQERADELRAALVALGVDVSRLLSQGFGESCPLDPAHTPAAWAKNRRVVLAVSTQPSITLSCNVKRTVAQAGGSMPNTAPLVCRET